MSDYNNNEQMLDMYLFETFQNIEQLENCILDSEKSNGFSQEAVNEIFRNMHTIKGSSAMMLFNNISNLAHSMEDLFYFIREQKPQNLDTSTLTDLLLEGLDFIKIELEKIKGNDFSETSCSALIERIKQYLDEIKQYNNSGQMDVRPASNEKVQYYIVPDISGNSEALNCYKAIVFFEDGCEMENIRAYTIVHNLKQDINEVIHYPEDILDDEMSIQEIKEKGFTVYFKTEKSYKVMKKFFEQTIFLKSLDLTQLQNDFDFAALRRPNYSRVINNEVKVPVRKSQIETETKEKDAVSSNPGQNIISVNITKLDHLMDLVGEMVISEALVTQNPDLDGLELDNFMKAARQHHKIISEVQDLVMSIRMVPLAATFHKMHRLIRDMNKNLNKETELVLIGEETEVDKNIIEHISDPLMHLVRNCVDHGIEPVEERISSGKERTGKITIEAKNSGNDVLVRIMDDGKGLNKEKILVKARENGLISMAQNDLSDRDIYNLIFLPGFSTKDTVSEYSGRGVGMDVVTKNIEAIGGTVLVESEEGRGTIFTLKIPLTLAIIDGMNIRVGDSRFTIPITSIKESFQPKATEIITDPDGNEMIMVRGNCYNIYRLHQLYSVNTDITKFEDGILIMVEQDEKAFCLFADELLGQQQVVVKALPDYIKNRRKIRGITGCTLLGDGSISLIIDILGLIALNSN
jgi:two-component system chemotaxis sensor kinase CheA